MRRTIRWLLLVGLIAGILSLFGSAVRAQSGITITVLCSQYLRAEPSEDAQRVGLMNPGETHLVLGQYAGWLYVQIDAGLQGWAFYGSCLQLNGNFGALPRLDPAQFQPAVYTGPPTAAVACSQYLRRAPSTDAEVLTILSDADSPLSISGRTEDNNWMLVTTVGGQVGWTAYTECTQVRGSFLSVPVMESGAAYGGPPVLQVLCAQYVRAQPSTDAPRVAIMEPGDEPWSIDARDTSGSWLLVTHADGSFTGWTANGSCISILGNFRDIPIVSEGEASYGGPPVATLACSQYLRAFPSMEGRHLAVLDATSGVLEVVGRTEDIGWVYVRTANGSEGWMASGNCLRVQGNLFHAPLIEPQPYSGPPLVQVACPQNVRAAPAGDAERVAVLQPADAPLEVVARTGDLAWVYVELPGGLAGWTANGACVTVTGDLFQAPVAEADTVVAISVYQGQPVANVVCAQYLRTGPSTDYRSLGPMSPGAGPFEVIGRSEDGSWLLLMQEDGSQGWAAWGECLQVRGDVYSLPIVRPRGYDGPPIATVRCSQYLRTLPTEEARSLVIINGTEGQLRISGRTADQRWMQITMEDGTVGWAATGICLGVLGNFYDVPVVELGAGEEYGGPPIASVSCSQYLRAAPSTSAEELAILQPTDGLLDIVGRNADTTWLYVRRADGLEGWTANAECLVIQGNLASLPLQAVTTYQGPPVADVLCDVNLRRNPIADAEVMTVLTADTGLFNIIGRDDDAGWVLVESSSGLVGWLGLGDCVTTRGNVLNTPTPAGPRDPQLWTVIRAEGACDGSDQASQIIAAFNRTGPISAVSRQCTSDAQGLQALTQFRVEVAIVTGGCPGFQEVRLSGGQSLCHRFLRTTQVDDFMNYARGR